MRRRTRDTTGNGDNGYDDCRQNGFTLVETVVIVVVVGVLSMVTLFVLTSWPPPKRPVSVGLLLPMAIAAMAFWWPATFPIFQA